MNYWDKIFGKLMIQAIRINDNKMKKQLSKIVIIPNNIRVHILTEYVK
jgi:hypothetical protein